MHFIFGGTLKWCSHCGKWYGSSSEYRKKNHHVIQQFHFWV